MVILLSNYRNMLIIRWQYNFFIFSVLYYKEIQLSLPIEPHRHTINSSYIRATLILNQALFSTLQSFSEKSLIAKQLL